MDFEEEHSVGLGLVLRRSMTLGWIWVLPNVVVIDSPMSAKSISMAMATAKATAEARRLTTMA